MRLRICVRKLS